MVCGCSVQYTQHMSPPAGQGTPLKKTTGQSFKNSKLKSNQMISNVKNIHLTFEVTAGEAFCNFNVQGFWCLPLPVNPVNLAVKSAWYTANWYFIYPFTALCHSSSYLPIVANEVEVSLLTPALKLVGTNIVK